MARKKPGPKAQRRNPSPLPDEETELYSADARSEWARFRLSELTAWVAVEEIDAAERALRREIKVRRGELKRRSDETLPAATLLQRAAGY